MKFSSSGKHFDITPIYCVNTNEPDHEEIHLSPSKQSGMRPLFGVCTKCNLQYCRQCMVNSPTPQNLESNMCHDCANPEEDMNVTETSSEEDSS